MRNLTIDRKLFTSYGVTVVYWAGKHWDKGYNILLRTMNLTKEKSEILHHKISEEYAAQGMIAETRNVSGSNYVEKYVVFRKKSGSRLEKSEFAVRIVKQETYPVKRV